jgi:3-isopropylmalate/(R)-2-methylmalate dehydratase small subunit
MQTFTTLHAVAVPLDRANVDTDQILPARFLKKPRSAGYGRFLFHDERRRSVDFPLDQPVFRSAAILLADRNFGCGSSREGAVYGLLDGGIRCVIAPSFGDIFAANAAKNGLLTITLPAAEFGELRERLRAAPGVTLIVDLPAETITDPDGRTIHFEIDAFRKRCLIEGLDDIDLTLECIDAIAAFDERAAREQPWRQPTPQPRED